MPENTLFNRGLLESLRRISTGDPALRSGLEEGLGISGLGSPTTHPNEGFFGFGTLGRVSDQLDAPLAQLLARSEGESFIGGQRSLEASRAVGDLFKLADQASVVDPNLQQALEARRARLGGFTPEQMTQLREAGTEGINNQLQTGLRAAGLSNLGRGLRGGAAAIQPANLINQSLQARRGLERDIGLANIAEQERQLGAFTDLAGTIDANRFNRGFNATGALNEALLPREQFETQDRANRLGNFQNLLFNVRNDLLNRQGFNLGQLAREKSGQLGLLFGTAGLATQREGQRTAEELAREGLEVARTAQVPVPTINFPSFDLGSTGIGTGFANEDLSGGIENLGRFNLTPAAIQNIQNVAGNREGRFLNF